MLGLVAAWLLAASPDLRADLFIRSEVRVGHLAPDFMTSISRTSAEVQPIGALAVESRQWRIRFTYGPRFWMPDLGIGRLDIDHQVDIRAEASPLPSLSLAATGTASRGVLDPLTDMWTSIAPKGTSNTTVTAYDPLFYESFRTAVDATYRLGAASAVAASAYAGYSRSDEAHRDIMPPQRSLGGSLGWSLAVDARNLVRANLNANVIRTYAGGIDPILNAEYPDSESGYIWANASWRRRLSTFLSGTLGAGASYVRDTSTFLDPINGWAPLLEVGLDLASDRPGPTLRTLVRYAPEVDRTTGRARKVVSGSTVYDWPISSETTFSAGLQASALIPQRDPATIALEIRLSRRMGDTFMVRAGARTRRQTAIQQSNFLLDTSSRAQAAYLESTGFLAVDWDVLRKTRGQAPVGAK